MRPTTACSLEVMEWGPVNLVAFIDPSRSRSNPVSSPSPTFCRFPRREVLRVRPHRAQCAALQHVSPTAAAAPVSGVSV